MKPRLLVLCVPLVLAALSSHAAEPAVVEQAHAIAVPITLKPYIPPSEQDIPDDEFGASVRLGKHIFTETSRYAAQYVGNGLQCANCHLGAGRLAHSAPLWGAWVKYPAYRSKNKMVNTMEERIQGCFRYSMNGSAPPADSRELKAVMTYAYWLAEGAPTGLDLPGRGYPKLADPAQSPDFTRGQKVFMQNCALCHGADGQGTKTSDKYQFPPLWGDASYNWGAGMHRINTAAAFIRANMPYGKAGSLSVQEAWDVAFYVNSHERPQDPRFSGDVQATKAEFHDHQCQYGETVDKQVLGARN